MENPRATLPGLEGATGMRTGQTTTPAPEPTSCCPQRNPNTSLAQQPVGHRLLQAGASEPTKPGKGQKLRQSQQNVLPTCDGWREKVAAKGMTNDNRLEGTPRQWQTGAAL
jgi:hypothetical protein